ncbi:MAG: HAD hydrolase family protein, partial [Phycisphaerae bacterium]|nr:HAD hydrolase family protein [Phycisphaerae bacterium]
MNTTEWDVLVVDLDGTLLCKQGEVSEQNLHALDSVRELGIEVIVATGRSFRECKHIVERMGHYGVCITASGSQLTTHEGQGITRSVVGSSVVEQVTNTVNAKGHRALLLKDDSACGMPYVLVGDSPLHDASTWWFESLHIPYLEVPLIEDDPYPEHTLR